MPGTGYPTVKGDMVPEFMVLIFKRKDHRPNSHLSCNPISLGILVFYAFKRSFFSFQFLCLCLRGEKRLFQVLICKHCST